MSFTGTEIDKLFVEKKTKPGPIGQNPIYNEVILKFSYQDRLDCPHRRGELML